MGASSTKDKTPDDAASPVSAEDVTLSLDEEEEVEVEDESRKRSPSYFQMAKAGYNELVKGEDIVYVRSIVSLFLKS